MGRLYDMREIGCVAGVLVLLVIVIYHCIERLSSDQCVTLCKLKWILLNSGLWFT